MTLVQIFHRIGPKKVSSEIRDTCTRLLEHSQIILFPIHKVWWLGLTNRANVYTHVKKSFKTQHDRNPIDPTILATIGHRFIAKQFFKTKIADAQV